MRPYTTTSQSPPDSHIHGPLQRVQTTWLTSKGPRQLSSSTPVEVTGISDAIAVSAGERGSCAPLLTGEVECWGSNELGQLGNGTTEDSSTPVLVSDLTGAIAISAGAGAPCAVISGGELKCWGSNRWGELDYAWNPMRENQNQRHSSIPLTMPVAGVMAVEGGAEHICALEESGDVYCWGDKLIGSPNNGIYNEHSEVLTPWGAGR